MTRYDTNKDDMMKSVETAFDKLNTEKKGMLNMQQSEILLRELMKSGS